MADWLPLTEATRPAFLALVDSLRNERSVEAEVCPHTEYVEGRPRHVLYATRAKALTDLLARSAWCVLEWRGEPGVWAEVVLDPEQFRGWHHAVRLGAERRQVGTFPRREVA